MTSLAIRSFRGIISSAKADGSQAFFLVLAAAIAKDQRNSYTVKIAPDTLAKRLPSALAAMEYLGLVLSNRISPIKKRTGGNRGALGLPQRTQEVRYD